LLRARAPARRAGDVRRSCARRQPGRRGLAADWLPRAEGRIHRARPGARRRNRSGAAAVTGLTGQPERLPPVDVAIVGLGAAGGIAARRFGEAGLAVAGIEAGPRVERSAFRFDELANDIRNALGTAKVNGEIPTWRASSEVEATTARDGRIVSLMSNGVGGGTIHYAGQHFRLAPWHFAVRSATAARYGTGALPADCTATDWPLPYAGLEP